MRPSSSGSLIGRPSPSSAPRSWPVPTASSSNSPPPPRFAGESTAGNRCLITVEDNGIGFDPKYAERVFSAFERLHSRADYDGTGIGLSIARKIAWRHRGELTATSAPDVGSTFTLTLPLAQATGEPVAAAA